MYNKKSAELRQITVDGTQLNLEKVDFEKIRETLQRGIVAFAELRNQWSVMVLFFQISSHIIDVMKKSVKNLGEAMDGYANENLIG